MKNRLKKSLLILLIFITGCSSTTFIYNRIDFLLPWYLESYVDLDRDQKQDLKELLIPFFKWHREQELPEYANIIGRVEVVINNPVELESIKLITTDFEESWFRLEDEMIAWAIPMAANLSDEQINKFIQVLQTKASQSESKYLSRNDQMYENDNYKRIRKNLKRFMGALTSEQRKLVKTTSQNMKRVDGEWIESRKSFIEKLQYILKKDEGWQQRLQNITHRDDLVNQNYRKTYSYNIDLTQRLLVSILNSRTDKQDKKLRAQLLKYKADINSLTERI